MASCYTSEVDTTEVAFIQDILEEIDDDGPEPTEESYPEHEMFTDKSTEFHELVLQVLEEMESDQGLGPLHAHIRQCQEQVPELCDKLEFISACKPAQGLKNTPAVKEKAWGQFHTTLVSHLGAISQITENVQLSSFLCLKLFERILSPIMPLQQPSSIDNEVHSQEELDIICYIGGSIVSKVKKCSKRLQSKEPYLDVIDYLVATEASGTESTQLIDCYDRGGLTRIKPQVFYMFITMEDIFVSMGTVLNVKAFIRKCGEHDDVLCGFYETVYESETDDMVKEQIIKKILELYFTVRVHQKCRVYMDRVRNIARVTKKEKALRQKLKT